MKCNICNRVIKGIKYHWGFYNLDGWVMMCEECNMSMDEQVDLVYDMEDKT